jgi:hypothetical protein
MSGSTTSVIALAALLATCVSLDRFARRGHDWGTAAQALGAAMRITPRRATVLTAGSGSGCTFWLADRRAGPTMVPRRSDDAAPRLLPAKSRASKPPSRPREDSRFVRDGGQCRYLDGVSLH